MPTIPRTTNRLLDAARRAGFLLFCGSLHRPRPRPLIWRWIEECRADDRPAISAEVWSRLCRRDVRSWDDLPDDEQIMIEAQHYWLGTIDRSHRPYLAEVLSDCAGPGSVIQFGRPSFFLRGDEDPAHPFPSPVVIFCHPARVAETVILTNDLLIDYTHLG